MYDPKVIIDLIAKNVRETMSPFGIPKFLANTWWKKAGLAQKGEYLLFTGMMYQFVPYIEKSTQYLEQFEDSKWTKYMPYAGYVPGYLSGTGLALMTSAKEKNKADQHLLNIVKILKKSGVDFKYVPELDHYSGILLYDLGDQESFVEHARIVAKKLKRQGIEKIITVDPHTTYALKVLYPKYTGISFDVKAYFEMVNFTGSNGSGRVTLHDPCFYGRYLELSDVPRQVLSGFGIEYKDVEKSEKFTNCCGGPAESISPKLSSEIVQRRKDELETAGEKIVSMCPICLGNLKKAGADVEDLSSLLARCIN
ncbi:Cysteine-rich domain-containing protein [Desulfonema limicola]|uniref:Cysteine-rich domain-containing protein n=1 Tax=Desulfonema limicola TaxID=45656 RepID=A0A975GIL6_9BACT|nr:(Fe-S)-binding protein [Desulfonema limicola]QTA82571.1 Cysteine-rich domain-containing protein [Desulfonema limicola]